MVGEKKSSQLVESGKVFPTSKVEPAEGGKVKPTEGTVFP